MLLKFSDSLAFLFSSATVIYMKQSFTSFLLIGAAMLATAGHAAAQATPSHEGAHPTAGQSVGRITITNLSNQTLAPIVVATHRQGATPIFVPGEAASNELATLAETGSPQALEAMLNTDPNVLFATYLTGMATVIGPGETVSGDIVFDFGNSSVSIAGMLVSTNDAFVAYNGAEIPTFGSATYLAHAWDAGSEANTEACADLPGPPCSEDSGNARVTEGAEGFVFIHRGIQGTAEVPPARYDWRGPVAMITVSGVFHGLPNIR